MKSVSKAALTENAKEMKMTGGGSYKMNTDNCFGFTDKEVLGLKNNFDSDNINISSITLIEENQETAIDDEFLTSTRKVLFLQIHF